MSTNNELKDETANGTKSVLCAVCKSDDKVEFLTITDCNLCVKCQDELKDGFEQAMTMDREDYPEL
jgi:hypothetical protein